MNLAFFISAAYTFTLNIAMETPEKKTISLKTALLNRANLAEMPNEIKVKIINDLVNNIIANNKDLPAINVIKLIAKELLPLRQINSEFDNLIKFYVKNELTKILISYGFKPLTIVDLLNQATLSKTPVEIKYLILDTLVQNIIDSNEGSSVINIIKPIVKELLPLSQVNMEFYKIINDYISRDLSIILNSNGIDINQKDAIGNTALMNTLDMRQPELAKLIIGKGANVNERDKYGYTALMLAVKNGHKDIVQLLIGKGADINKKSNVGITALIWAALYGHKSIVELLIKNNANVNKKNCFRETALMFAAKCGHKDIVELLIDNGANVDQMNDDGDTALVLATRANHKDIVQLLEATKNKQIYSGKKKWDAII